MKRHYKVGLATVGTFAIVGSLSLVIGTLVVAGAIVSLAVVTVPTAMYMSWE